MKKNVTIGRKKLLFDGYVQVEEVELSYPADTNTPAKTTKRTAIVRDDAVAAVVYRPDSDELVLVKQFRYPICLHGDAYIVELPAGMTEKNEAPCGTMRRELIEEIGYQAKHIQFVQTFFVAPGISSERLHLYYVEVAPEDRVGLGGGLEEESEDIEVLHWPKNTVLTLLREGKISDGKTLIGLQWFFLNEPWKLI